MPMWLTALTGVIFLSCGWAPGQRIRASELAVRVQAAEVDGFVVQVVDGPDVANGAAAGAHEDGVGRGLRAGELHAGQERAVADAGGAKERALALHQVVHAIDLRQLRLAHGRAQAVAFGAVPRP